MAREEIMEMVREEIRIRCELIVKADSHETMLSHYYGASAIKSFWIMQINQGCETEFELELEEMIENAHSEYYRIAETDLKNAHKRLF